VEIRTIQIFLRSSVSSRFIYFIIPTILGSSD
jgi:hypothetical protein